MTSPGGIGPERLAEIVDGASPRDDEERAMLALMEATRELEPGASQELRRRVLDGPPPEPVARRFDPRGWLGSAVGRRRLLVGAPVVAGLIALAVAIPVLDGGSETPARDDATAVSAGAAGSVEAAPPVTREGLDGSALESAPALGGADLAAPAPTAPDSERAQQVTASTRVQVDGVEDLSRASGSAMRTVQRLGGFTASSDYSVPNGAVGTNLLVFRVPVAKVEAALTAFGRLGVVTAQSANIVDLTARLDNETSRIDRLGVRIAELRARLAAQPSDEVALAELARAEAQLRKAEAARAATLERTRLATVRLTLTTEGPPPPAVEEGRFAGPIGRAADRLVGAAAWTLGALVLVVPFALVMLPALWALLRLRGRGARRLMQSA